MDSVQVLGVAGAAPTLSAGRQAFGRAGSHIKYIAARNLTAEKDIGSVPDLPLMEVLTRSADHLGPSTLLGYGQRYGI